MTRTAFEEFLDSGRIEIQATNGKWYRCRRNGRTRTWKRDPDRFATPIKWTFRNCYTIVHSDLSSGLIRVCNA